MEPVPGPRNEEQGPGPKNSHFSLSRILILYNPMEKCASRRYVKILYFAKYEKICNPRNCLSSALEKPSCLLNQKIEIAVNTSAKILRLYKFVQCCQTVVNIVFTKTDSVSILEEKKTISGAYSVSSTVYHVQCITYNRSSKSFFLLVHNEPESVFKNVPLSGGFV